MTIPGFSRFDSLAVEASGISLSRRLAEPITAIAPDGGIRREVKMPDTHPTNICFVGLDMRTAYVSLSRKGDFVVMGWPVPGLRLNLQE